MLGRGLIPALVGLGHEVVATTRRDGAAPELAALGATPVVVDAFDAPGLARAVADARPELIIHQLTDLSAFNGQANSRLRIEGTRNLVDAARAAGVERMIAQSIAWAYASGTTPARESDPLDLAAPSYLTRPAASPRTPDAATAASADSVPSVVTALEATSADAATDARRTTVGGVAALESAVAELSGGLVLRYGLLYGPGTWYAADGALADRARQGELPATDAIVTFLRIDDAVAATIAALNWPDGIVNVVDDDPASGTVWVPEFARAVGAPEPRIDLSSGACGRPVSAQYAHELGWRPQWLSWREGFAHL